MKKSIFVLCVSFVLLSAKQISFKDQNDNMVILNEPPKRVAMFPIPHASFSIAIDAGPKRLITINPTAKKALSEHILGRIFPSALNLSTSGIGADFTPNVEELIKLKPDFALQWGHTSSDIVEPLKKTGINLAIINYRGNEENALEWFELLGNAYDKKERVDEILSHRKSVFGRIKSYVVTKPHAKSPKILTFYGRANGFVANGEGTYQHYAIKLIGAQNAVNFKGSKMISTEQLIASNPDIIILSSFDLLMPKDIYKNALFKNISAVKNKRVYKIPFGGDRWDPPTAESHFAWIWLGILAYGEDFARNFNLIDEMKKGYKILYGYDLKASDINEILRVDENKISSNYNF